MQDGTQNIPKVASSNLLISEREKVLISYVQEKTSRIASVVLLIAHRTKDNAVLQKVLEDTAMRFVQSSIASCTTHKERTKTIENIHTLTALLEAYARATVLDGVVVSLIVEELSVFLDFLVHLAWHEDGVETVQALALPIPKELFQRDRAVSDFYKRQEKEREYITSPLQRHGAPWQTKEEECVPRKAPATERMQGAQKDRRASILSLLQTKQSVTVREVSETIQNCSEKTIQRELLALVAQGVLKKEGERRWSTYSLA